MRICFNGLSDNDFENIGQYLPQLESLVIKTDKSLTDKTLEYICELKRLKSLEIYCNQQFTDSGVKQLLDNCPDINRLVLKHRYGKPLNINREIMNGLKKERKECRKFGSIL